MLTFVICLSALIISYFTYGKYLQKICQVDTKADPPSKRYFDGVDYMPMPLWKTFLIQLLNIAGTGPIFGAILGAMYGPVAFLWITIGGILIGAMHDYISGMISVKNGGISYPEIIGKFLGTKARNGTRVFILFSMILIGGVFMVTPSGILAMLTPISISVWVIIILVYYLIATLFPINTIIGRIYPIFGCALLFMALGILYALFFENYSIPNLSAETFHNMRADADSFPIFPTLFITIACGAVSGFHATQSPLMARCLKNEKEGRPIFFGSMICESMIALIWAAMAMAFFGNVDELGVKLSEVNYNPAPLVEIISHTTLGKIGGILAILGVVVAPITTGDTALRTARLIIADTFSYPQKKLFNRIWISIPIFVIAYLITQVNFNIIWGYFGWLNQIIAVITLWAIVVYLTRSKKNVYIGLIPALFMTLITTMYFFHAKQMLNLGQGLSICLSFFLTSTALIFYIRFVYKWNRKKEDPPFFG